MKTYLMGVIAMVVGSACSVGVVGSDLPVPKEDIPLTSKSETRTAVLASGCFWCTQAVFEEIPGVSGVVSGYAGDSKDKALYGIVSSHTTNHAECVQVTYDASKVTYGHLLHVFFYTHDPTTKNRQGPDAGTQYRSAIFYENEDQKRVAEAYIKQLDEAKVFAKPIVTTLEKLPPNGFYPAEQYHQDYAKLNPFQPYIQTYALPKAQKAKAKFGTTQPSATD